MYTSFIKNWVYTMKWSKDVLHPKTNTQFICKPARCCAVVTQQKKFVQKNAAKFRKEKI